jgi:hypothetical protein
MAKRREPFLLQPGQEGNHRTPPAAPGRSSPTPGDLHAAWVPAHSPRSGPWKPRSDQARANSHAGSRLRAPPCVRHAEEAGCCSPRTSLAEPRRRCLDALDMLRRLPTSPTCHHLCRTATPRQVPPRHPVLCHAPTHFQARAAGRASPTAPPPHIGGSSRLAAFTRCLRWPGAATTAAAARGSRLGRAFFLGLCRLRSRPREAIREYFWTDIL